MKFVCEEFVVSEYLIRIQSLRSKITKNTVAMQDINSRKTADYAICAFRAESAKPDLSAKPTFLSLLGQPQFSKEPRAQSGQYPQPKCNHESSRVRKHEKEGKWRGWPSHCLSFRVFVLSRFRDSLRRQNSSWDARIIAGYQSSKRLADRLLH